MGFFEPPEQRHPRHREGQPAGERLSLTTLPQPRQAATGRAHPWTPCQTIRGPHPNSLLWGTAGSAQSAVSPVVGDGQGDLKFGQELEILLFRLLREASAKQQQAQVLGPNHPVLGHRPGALDVEDPLQTLGQPDGVEEVEVPQAMAGVREVQQGARFDEEADGCPGRGGGVSVKQRAEGALGDLLPGRRATDSS